MSYVTYNTQISQQDNPNNVFIQYEGPTSTGMGRKWGQRPRLYPSFPLYKSRSGNYLLGYTGSSLGT